MTLPTHAIALTAIQYAIQRLGAWVNVEVAYPIQTLDSAAEQAIATAKTLTQWPATATPGPLQLVFDAIQLKQSQPQSHFWPAVAIHNDAGTESRCPNLPYPLPQQDLVELDQLKAEIKTELQSLSIDDWQNLSILTLILENYGSCLSYGQVDVALFDLARATAAIATSLAAQPEAKHLCLVAGDLSGIQPFIYTIASDGALKSLRARSFYLELMTEELTQQLLERLALPRTSVIYTGGGKSYLLAPAVAHTHQTVATLKTEFNHELFQKFQGKVSLNLASHDFLTPDVAGAAFSRVWEAVNQKLSVQKARKFDTQIETLLKRQDAHEPCGVCHRDDVKPDKLKPLGGEGVQACCTCNQMFELGKSLYSVGSFVRSQAASISGAETLAQPIRITLGSQTTYYHLFKGSKPHCPSSDSDIQTVYLINNWDIPQHRNFRDRNPTLLLLGNYGQKSKDEKDRKGNPAFMTAAEMAETAQGIARVGHLRMDVDRLGQIFAEGLKERYTLPRLAGLSRQMSYFFKVYLNSLADRRSQNLPPSAQQLSSDARSNLLFIYAGGDDLFITGSWNEVVEFAFDTYQSFRAYTGHHPDITLSGGISLNGPKYPLYQSADDAGEAEEAAKGNGRDSLGLFGQTFKWQEWFGVEDKPVSAIEVISGDTRSYLGSDTYLALFGVFPFVTRLEKTLGNQYPHSFVRNLLSTAQVQDQLVKAAQKKGNTEDAKDIRYFLHLPKIAYALARLPKEVKNANEKEFNQIKAALKSPYNAPYFRAIATWIDLLNR